MKVPSGPLVYTMQEACQFPATGIPAHFMAYGGDERYPKRDSTKNRLDFRQSPQGDA